MTKLILLILVYAVGIASSIFAEDATVKCDHFRLHAKDGRHLTGKNGVFTNSGFRGTAKDGTLISLRLDEIQGIDRSNGSLAGRGALVGATVGAFAILMRQNHPTDKSKLLSAVLDAAGVGAIVGVAIGSAFYSWDPVVLPKSTVAAQSYGMQLTFGFNF